jgi:SAM-dependent methyltransferase
MNAMTTTETPLPSAEELVGRLLEQAVGGFEILSLYLGEQLGYYKALAESGPINSAQLAAQTQTAERYAREWLEQQATAGFLTVPDTSADAVARVYVLPAHYEAVLVDPHSELFVAPLGRFMAGVGQQSEALLDAYRQGSGVSWAQFGDLARTAQADFNRPFFEHTLVTGYVSQIPEVDQALRLAGARVAEIGCGAGWASIALALGYPEATVAGLDIDSPSVEMARANLKGSGAEERVRFHDRDAADLTNAAMDEGLVAGSFDLVCAFECIHDMPDPVSVLKAMRMLAKADGTVLVMDERVGEEFGQFGDLVERFMYAASLLVCLPDGLSHKPSVGTGTVMRPATLRTYAIEAGFRDLEILPLEHDLFRFYRLKV